jgi:hypothetical protein
VRDSKGDVPHRGSTTDTTVTASGTAAANERVEVYDGNTSKGTASVGGTGNWSHAVANLGLGSHNLKAVAKYSDEPSSNVRSFEVKSPIPEFVLDPSQISLSGRLYVPQTNNPVFPPSWPAGTTARRVPSGGVPPYTYTSSNEGVVRADNNGNIFSRSNGSATITVKDSANPPNTKSYPVSVSGVIKVHHLGNNTYSAAQQTAASKGLRLPSRDELHAMGAQYPNSTWAWGGIFWSTTAAPGFYKNVCVELVPRVGDWHLSTLPGHSLNVLAL